MKVSELNPYVRYSDKRITKMIYKGNVMAYDFRLFYILKGQCTLFFDGKQYEIKKNMQILFPPCRQYRFETSEPIELMVLNFDLDFDRAGSLQLPPSTVDRYKFEKAVIPPDNKLFNEIIIIENATENLDIISTIVDKRKLNTELRDELVSTLMKQLLINTIIIKDKCNHNISPLTEKILGYIEENYQKNITNNELGLLFNYHPSYINKKFHKETGITIRKYLISKRIAVSKELLKSTKFTIYSIAMLCGFESAPYYTKYFRRMTGLTPKEYRNRYNIL